MMSEKESVTCEEMKKVKLYIYARSSYDGIGIGASTDKYQSSRCCDIVGMVSAPLTEVEIDVPALSDSDITKILSGARLEMLESKRDKLKADYGVNMAQVEREIAELLCIESDDSKAG